MPRASALWIILLGAFSVTTGRLFGLVELYVIGVALFTAVVMAIAIVRRPAGLLLRRHVRPAQPSAGQDATVEVLIDAIRDSPLCRVREMVGEAGRAADIDVSPLRLGASARSAYQLPTDRRGVVTVGPATLEVGDPLGLAVRRARLAGREQFVVLPHWSRIALPHLTACEGDMVDMLRRALLRVGQPDEFLGIREYAPGDDPRRVNWKATARSENPLVNDFESNPEVVTTLLVDTANNEHDPDAFERVVSVATSFIMAESAGDAHPATRLRLALGSETVIEVDRSNRDDLTRRLATISPTDERGVRATPAQTGQLNAAVIVTGSPDAVRVAALRRGLGRVDALIVISCSCEAPRIDGTPVLRVTDFDDFARGWHRLVRRRRSALA